MNYILGGGLWTGRYHILWGGYSAGKSTLALHTAANAQNELGMIPVIIDAEGTMTDQWMEHCGIDLDQRVLIRSTRLEDVMEYVLPKMRQVESRYFFIFDSLNTLVMEQFYKDDDSTGAIGIYARSQTVLLQKTADAIISNTNHCALFIAQQTMGTKGQYFVHQGKFGNAATHWSTNIIRLSASDSSADTERDADDRIVNRKVTWKVEKSKQKSVQGTKGDYWFSPSSATIDLSREAFHLAVRNGVIEKRGAWFYYGDEKYHGEAKALEALGGKEIDNILSQLDNVELDFDVETVEE